MNPEIDANELIKIYSERLKEANHRAALFEALLNQQKKANTKEDRPENE
jgi:hypothetical protein